MSLKCKCFQDEKYPIFHPTSTKIVLPLKWQNVCQKHIFLPSWYICTQMIHQIVYLSRNNTRLRNVFLVISFSVKRLSELSDFSPLWVSAVLRFDELKTPLILHVCAGDCALMLRVCLGLLLYSFPKRFLLNSFFIFDSNLRSIAILTFGFFFGGGDWCKERRE